MVDKSESRSDHSVLVHAPQNEIDGMERLVGVWRDRLALEERRFDSNWITYLRETLAQRGNR